ncbi:damage-inducible protein DinB [soil metagenome]
MNDYFKRLFIYNDWANETIIENLQACDMEENSDALKITSHLINAQFIWMSRITNDSGLHIPAWKTHPLSELTSLAKRATEIWLPYIDNLTEQELNMSFDYSNSAGDQFTNTVGDALPHIVNHASYHRGQVAKLIRAKGFDPVNTDFITYARSVEKK